LSIIDPYKRAIEELRRGGVVALPTDTVFGLCALARDDDAVARVYAIKQRDRAQPLPVFVSSLEQATLITRWNDAAQRLAERFWPGALTIVLPQSERFHTLAAAGTGTIAVRVPKDPALREIAAQLGPITGTSANLSGMAECHSAEEVARQLGQSVDAIVDAPTDPDARPSTVVDCTQAGSAHIVREGAISAHAVREALSGVATLA